MCRNPELKLMLLLFCTLAVVKCTRSLPFSSNENEVDIPDEDETEDSIDLSMFGERIYGHSEEILTFENLKGNPEELGTYLEGDMLIPNDDETERNGIVKQSHRWPGAIVPYEINGKFTAHDLSVIKHAFREYHTKTCIRFRPRTFERNYVSITNANTGCWASVGRIGGRQKVNLQSPSCFMNNGTTMHELMHAIGFFHEQNRFERDNYVLVLNENVKPDMKQNFVKASPKTAHGYGVPYDYASVMHYSSYSFSINGQPTLKPLLDTPAARIMGQRKGFSTGDIAKINEMYHCKVHNEKLNTCS